MALQLSPATARMPSHQPHLQISNPGGTYQSTFQVAQSSARTPTLRWACLWCRRRADGITAFATPIVITPS
ncbi:MAG: hypothetical protein NZ874_00800 [Fimbriimonadales bacterium]|nr:hypothetical protein [Fimbriimonadales bacterium]